MNYSFVSSGENALLPQFFEDLFCNLECYEEYRLRTSNRFLRQVCYMFLHGLPLSCYFLVLKFHWIFLVWNMQFLIQFMEVFSVIGNS